MTISHHISEANIADYAGVSFPNIHSPLHFFEGALGELTPVGKQFKVVSFNDDPRLDPHTNPIGHHHYACRNCSFLNRSCRMFDLRRYVAKKIFTVISNDCYRKYYTGLISTDPNSMYFY